MKSEEHFRAIFDAVNDAIYIHDFEGNLLEVNQKASDNLGYNKSELLRMNISDIDVIDDVAQIKTRLEEILNKGQLLFESKHKCKDGTKIDVEVNARKMEYDGKPMVLSIIRDITERKKIEQKLVEAKEFSEKLIDTANAMIIGLDTNGQILVFNKAAEEITGYSKQELEGKNWFEVIVPKDRYPQVHEEFNRLVSGGLPKYFENPILTKSEEERFITWRNKEVIDKGKVTGTLSFGIDITEQKQVEATLHESEDKFKYVFDHSIIGKSITSPSGEIHVNNAFCEMLGYSQIELQNCKWQDITHPEDIEATQKIVDLIFSGEQDSARFIKRYVHKNGSIVWTDVGTSLRRDKEGKPLYFMTNVSDITERMQAEQALKDSEVQFRALFNDMAEGVCLHEVIYNDKGEIVNYKILDVNPRYEEILNLKKEDVVNHLANEVYKVPDPPYLEEFTGVTKTFKPFHFETYFAPMGKYFFISVSALGKHHFATIFFDITERKMAERELEAKNKELEQIVYVTSHDLRSPLVNVQGYSKELGISINAFKEVISKLELSAETFGKVKTIIEDVSVSLKYIENSIAKMDLLLHGLLRFSRSGTMSIKLENIDMNDLIAKVLSDFEFLIKTKKVNLEISDLPLCKGDNAMVSHVFSNLVDNAIKYLSPNREGVIKISGTKKNDRSIYYVEDNGIGIAKEHINKIFEIFYRLNPKSIDGVGLGLSIVQKMLNRLNGGIAVESELDKGSKFYITLPSF